MRLDVLNLDYLVALPASCEHWALLPVVDVQGLLSECGVVQTAKVACLLRVSSHFLLVALLNLLFLPFWRSQLFSLSADVGFDSLLRRSFLWLLCWHSRIVINFGELGHKGVKRGLSEAVVVL